MKVGLIAIVLTSAVAFSQTVKEPGHPSRHAAVGKHYGGGSSVSAANPKTEPLATQLAKIEQQGAHAPSSSASRATAAKPLFPKTPAKDNRNKPLRYTGKPRAASGTRH